MIISHKNISAAPPTTPVSHVVVTLEPVEKSYWNYFAKKYSLENLIIKDMIHQGDRYYVCFSKKIDL